MSKHHQNRSPSREIVVLLSTDELRTLGQLAHYYFRSMGRMRYIIRLTAPAEVRAKYRFISEESRWLQKFIESVPIESADHAGEIGAEFASRTIIAYWGRVLSSLHSKRARRRMKPEDVTLREGLAEKLCAAAQQLETRCPGSLESDLATRRPDEASWMREQLSTTPADVLSRRPEGAPSG